MPPDRADKLLEMAVDLSKKVRLMLINQFRILEILDKDNTEDHLRHATILKEGFAGEYYDVFSGIAEELSREECQEVADTLLIYWELQRAHESAREMISADEVRFPGYSGDSKDPEFRRSFYGRKWRRLRFGQLLWQTVRYGRWRIGWTLWLWRGRWRWRDWLFHRSRWWHGLRSS